MPFRPLTLKERRETRDKIRKAEERIGLVQRYLDDLRRRLEEGVWFPKGEEE